MKDLWSDSYEPIQDFRLPNDIIKDQCELLQEKTNGIIVARISKYEGPISSYKKTSGLNAAVQLFAAKETTIDIQMDLGDISEADLRFEFFLTSTSTPNYKYRIMFIQYELPFYPVYIVLDQGIALELELEQNTVYNTQSEFEDVLERILRSDKIKRIINSLLAISQAEQRVYTKQ